MKKNCIKLDSNEIARGYNKDYIRDILIREVFTNLDISSYPDSKSKKLIEAYSKYSDIDKANLINGNGSDEILDLIFSVYGKGKKVATMNPDFSMYDIYGEKYSSKLLKISCKSLDEFLDFAKRENADMIIFSNPNNPTGRAFDVKEIEKLVKGFNNMVVIDEAYVEFYRGSAYSLIKCYPNLIITRSCSKAVGMAGLRIGFGVSNEVNIKKLESIKLPYNIGIINQTLGAILLKDKDIIDKKVDEVIKNREILYKELQRIAIEIGDFNPLKSEGNFIYIETNLAKEVYEYLLKDNIYVRLFDSGIRITVGKGEENKLVIESLENYFKKECSELAV